MKRKLLKGKQISRGQVKGALKKANPTTKPVRQKITPKDIARFEWYVALVTPAREKYAVERLNDNGIPCVLPLHMTRRRTTRYHKMTEEKPFREDPFIPGYVFAGVTSRTSLSPVWRLPGLVHGFMLNNGKLLDVAHTQVEKMMSWGSIYQPLEGYAFMASHYEFSVGNKVRAPGGPFDGMEFTVKEINGSRAMVVLEMLGLHEVELELGLLRPA